MNLTVSQKLKGLIGLLILFIVAGTAIGYFGISYVGKNYREFLSHDVAEAQAGMKAQIYYGLTVRAFKNYLIRKEPKYIDEFNKAVAGVKEQLKTYEGLADSPEEKAGVKKTWETIGPFETSFKDMVVMREKNNDIPGVDKTFGRVAAPVYEAILKLDEFATKGLAVKQDTLDSRIWRLKMIEVFGSLIGCVLAIIIATIVARSIVRQIIIVRDAARKVAAGDLSKDVPVKGNDELSEMAIAFNEMMGSLRQVIGKINDTTNSTASSSEQLSATVQQIAKRSEEQAIKTNQVATASTEMAQTVIDVAKNTSNMASSAAATLDTAHHGADIVSKTVDEVREIAHTVSQLAQGMVSLGERSRQIGDIVGVIKDIADQTNLLALNAAIEAARAGEQGRGFAVVADEVRKLAEKTTNSTSQIGEMISAIQVEMERAVQAMDAGSSKVDTGVQLATQAGEALQDIVHSVTELQTMVQQIASATEEMSTVSEHINNDIEVIAEVSKETSSSTVEISQAAGNVARLSGELKEEANRFRLR